jgi:hypothetical protein
MTFEEMTRGIEDAQRTVNMADRAVRELSPLIVGRLRRAYVPGWVLEELKRELKNYNIHTGRWKND